MTNRTDTREVLVRFASFSARQESLGVFELSTFVKSTNLVMDNPNTRFDQRNRTMNLKSKLPLASWMAAMILAVTAQAAEVPLDATSGSSGSRKMVTISKIVVTTSNAAITYSEGYRNGTLRLYYSTTAFASKTDTTRATVTKMNVTSRGSGTITIPSLTASTKYYYRFQGYYPQGVANYWATGSFSTEAIAAVQAGSVRVHNTGKGFEAVDALGRRGSGSPVAHTPEGSDLQPRTDRR